MNGKLIGILTAKDNGTWGLEIRLEACGKSYFHAAYVFPTRQSALESKSAKKCKEIN